jgi:hypothetical protein
MVKKRFTRSYPLSWSIQKISDFMADCYRVGRIPKGATVKSKKKRGGIVEVTWTWKE